MFLKNGHMSIDQSVNQFTTFFLVIKDTNEIILTWIGPKIKNTNIKHKIINAIIFKADQKENNAYIFLVDISINIPKEAED